MHKALLTVTALAATFFVSTEASAQWGLGPNQLAGQGYGAQAGMGGYQAGQGAGNWGMTAGQFTQGYGQGYAEGFRQGFGQAQALRQGVGPGQAQFGAAGGAYGGPYQQPPGLAMQVGTVGGPAVPGLALTTGIGPGFTGPFDTQYGQTGFGAGAGVQGGAMGGGSGAGFGAPAYQLRQGGGLLGAYGATSGAYGQ